MIILLFVEESLRLCQNIGTLNSENITTIIVETLHLIISS
jgi:hypothetical protein